MSAPRRPADIARQVRLSAEVAATNHGDGVTADALDACADELDALEARWPTADEIAQSRHVVTVLRSSGHDAWADRLEAFFDRIDPPEADPWALLASVVTDELLTVAEAKRRIAAARAALDARGQA